MRNDEEYIKRTFLLARKGVGHVNPNPLVGAVIVKNNVIIGEGYHHQYGGDHAEVVAIKNTSESVEGATVYVNLEPCSHYGKTPPCAELLVQERVARVVIATKDPNPLVAGRGVKILQDAGIDVVTGVLEDEARELNRVFIKYITSQKPFVVMKSAMTLDGKIATRVGDSKWVSGEKSREIVHQMRNEYTAIMVGINTVIADDPALTTRLKKPGRNPIRIVVDSSLRIPMDVKLVKDRKAPTIIVHGDKAAKEKIAILRKAGVETLEASDANGKVDISLMMKLLGKKGIDGILLEGGGTLNFSAIQQKVVDEVFMFIAPKIIGGELSKSPVAGKGVDLMREAYKIDVMRVMQVEQDLLIRGKISY